MTSYRETGSDVERIPMVIALRGVTTFPLQGSWMSLALNFQFAHVTLSPCPFGETKEKRDLLPFESEIKHPGFQGGVTIPFEYVSQPSHGVQYGLCRVMMITNNDVLPAGSAENWQVRSKKARPLSIDMRYHPFVHLVTSAILVAAQNEASEEIDLGLINASGNTTDALGVSTT